MMTRRGAMMLMGAVVACLGGRSSRADETSGPYISDQIIEVTPTNYVFMASSIQNIIIEREGKPDLVVPFADVIKALEGKV